MSETVTDNNSERTKLSKSFMVLTKYSDESDKHGTVIASKPVARRNKTLRRSVSSERILCVGEELAEAEKTHRPMGDAFKLPSPLECLVQERLRRAEKLEKDPTPVVMAFTLIERYQYRDVTATTMQDESEILHLSHDQAVSISDDQLRADMDKCKEELTAVCALQCYLRELGYYVMVWRLPYKQRNTDESMLGLYKYVIEPFLRGYYYKVLVDFSRSKCKG